MEKFKQSINWNSPDRYDQVNQMVRNEILEGVERYKQEGMKGFGEFQDHKQPLNRYETLKTLLGRRKLAPIYLPEFHEYLLEYPKLGLEGTEDFFYWERVKFGLKPTLRVNHVTIYPIPESEVSQWLLCSHQLYSSHYFQVALDAYFLVQELQSAKEGFYLITLKLSRQEGLTGFKGAFVRPTAVGRARSGMETALDLMKERLEAR
jgi:hypothetical protein